ncbi:MULTISPECIES: bifunctional allose-6-phosphate isomerase/ribose-5-phosphate isomerase RpiB [unclassified Brenneria]|uniref:bifunctional allose-6-phosphate isomerase/ribose-5-phosphate isomerase RpiB n=1 Tax=unclassified Brenneria TaxID=2634434 RepID=UPI001556BD2C|nr:MULTISPECIES: bifunctional allose-6-phosphate isomerase/ribose-5-phosphate isomerase RpiB [unclassified Brenneria]MBJ7223103.1 ribose 5-phosphate isomerase B [Brenneria sp. L3-3C-1]MEE3644342.1 bifunctional allose-6-phosphate isomerase/ribose-5-phosphate isomerase RpiB [Brenneria sp. L3_3C_1]MEE3652567.1 bifunctional allose-6-phosphate isomerase/ribose-5-phosphate isomerase RpiB [Brenneria sp. HEZEL_4_2_4]NPD02523.1 ribose 5-phosphate isomerase B [Brenneria sp. hezel4-2-4]
MRKIVLGCDHVGFELKAEIVAHIQRRGVTVMDKGTWSSERTDYPRYAVAVAEAVVAGDAEGGILICGTGVGIAITANKFPGIRAVVCSEPYSAQLSRQHNNTNVLAFGSRVVGSELAKMIVDAWLDAQFEGGRHQARIDAIGEVESRFGCAAP